jgi:hypothetical protein
MKYTYFLSQLLIECPRCTTSTANVSATCSCVSNVPNVSTCVNIIIVAYISQFFRCRQTQIKEQSLPNDSPTMKQDVMTFLQATICTRKTRNTPQQSTTPTCHVYRTALTEFATTIEYFQFAGRSASFVLLQRKEWEQIKLFQVILIKSVRVSCNVLEIRCNNFTLVWKEITKEKNKKEGKNK